MVRVLTETAWTQLPANGVTIEFSGSSAQIDGLPNYDTYYLQVRTVNSAGNSRWSGFLDLVNDVSNQATSTPAPTATQAPAPTATQAPVATATQAPVPTATQAPVATGTPTPSPLPPGSPSDVAVMVNMLGDTVIAIKADSRFVSDETSYLDCVRRETGSRPGSFEETLRMYTGSTKAAIDRCDVQTSMFDTYHTVAQEKLTNLMNTQPVSGARTLTIGQVVRNRYNRLFADEASNEFTDNIGDLVVMKRYAEFPVPNGWPSKPAAPLNQRKTRSHVSPLQT